MWVSRNLLEGWGSDPTVDHRVAWSTVSTVSPSVKPSSQSTLFVFPTESSRSTTPLLGRLGALLELRGRRGPARRAPPFAPICPRTARTARTGFYRAC